MTHIGEGHMISPSMAVGGVLQRSAHADQTPQQSSGDDGNGSDRLDVHADRRTDSRPAETKRHSVRLLRADHTTSDLYQLRQIQSLSAAHKLLQRLSTHTDETM